MRVRELLQQLSALPPEAEVLSSIQRLDKESIQGDIHVVKLESSLVVLLVCSEYY